MRCWMRGPISQPPFWMMWKSHIENIKCLNVFWLPGNGIGKRGSHSGLDAQIFINYMREGIYCPASDTEIHFVLPTGVSSEMSSVSWFPHPPNECKIYFYANFLLLRKWAWIWAFIWDGTWQRDVPIFFWKTFRDISWKEIQFLIRAKSTFSSHSSLNRVLR